MNDFDEPALEARDPGEGDSAVIAAIVRIGASLDLDTVLREALEGARALTGARYGAIYAPAVPESPLDFVTSGLTPEEHGTLAQWPDGLRLFEHLRDLTTPRRLPDLEAYARSLGCSPLPLPCRALLGTPMRHQDEPVGGFFLAEKEGGFTERDEAVLALFAQQAAAAIAHARAHRDERRARADLEALVETSPIGVVVLDAVSGAPPSFNREAKRIVAGLHTPGHPIERLAEEVTCRRGDGREATLADLRSAERVRAEEVELSLPDGRSVRTLLDATPIRSREGAVETVVVTLQDLAPFEALERSRAEFLGLVSHELRGPLAAIKGSAATALGDSRDPDRAELRQFLRIVEEQADRMDGLITDLMDAGRIGAGALPVDAAPEELSALVERARTAFSGGGSRHAVVVDLPADLPPVMADGRRVVQVLDNLLANAARHSPETSPIRVAAARDGAHVEVSVADEGEGVAPDALPHLFSRHAGADPRGRGSGLGLVICKGIVEAHGGRIRAESGGPGRGTRVAFTLPVAEAEPRASASASPPERRDPERTPILVVDDDPNSLRQVRAALAAAGYAPVVTTEPGEVPRLVETKRPRLVLLDLVLPGTDGIALMETLPALADLPVIFISAYGRGDTVARALEAGAADYIVKPFSPAELVARIKGALRRRAGPGREPFRLGDLAIDYEKRRVTVAGRPVRLTATEYGLLRALSLDAGGVTTYESLLRQVWGEHGASSAHPVRSAVKKLRHKLGDEVKKPKYIFTERGVGYRMPASDGP
ncbi:MAG: response regulator [Gemmatimonadota bacterium]|nr:response regulator [Gemmatimonadota bacterium]